MRSCVHQPAAGGHVKAARCGKSTPEATRRGSKRAAATREGGCVHTRTRPGPLFTTRPRLAVRTELPLCALAPRLSTHQWDLTSSNFAPAHVGTVASELGRAAVPQGGFQADGQARRQPAESGEATCMERLSRWVHDVDTRLQQAMQYIVLPPAERAVFHVSRPSTDELTRRDAKKRQDAEDGAFRRVHAHGRRAAPPDAQLEAVRHDWARLNCGSTPNVLCAYLG